MMHARVAANLRLRADEFGGIAYVPSRDDFFALDADVFAYLSSLGSDWAVVSTDATPAVARLASLELVETDPPTSPKPYSGPSFIGSFQDIVSLREPLVLNCFSTAHCPLVCRYCHAADLMGAERRGAEDREGREALANVVATARAVPSIVAVITGGDPLTRPERSRVLIEELSPHKALVLDTSGVAPESTVEAMVPLLWQHKVHVRVSIDSANPAVQRGMRPLNRKYGPGLDPYVSALNTVRMLLAAGIPVTVQSVVSRINDTATELLPLRDFLVDIGVRHWVLHLAVEAGDARKAEARRQAKGARARGVLPKDDVRSEVWRVIRDTIDRMHGIDIRVTDNKNTPNSVLLLGPDGVLYTEGLAHRGKVVLFDPNSGRPDRVQSLFYLIDKFGHARRYLNWNSGMFEDRNLGELCIACAPGPEVSPAATDIVERERKYRITDEAGLVRWLAERGLKEGGDTEVVDRYYDTVERNLAANDFVVRVRLRGGGAVVALKGPRFRRLEGEYDRIELEFEAIGGDEVQRELAGKGLMETWRLERQRTYYGRPGAAMAVCVDRLEGIGVFVEIEGPERVLAELSTGLEAIAEVETRNYREIVVDWFRDSGQDPERLLGLGRGGALVRR